MGYKYNDIRVTESSGACQVPRSPLIEEALKLGCIIRSVVPGSSSVSFLPPTSPSGEPPACPGQVVFGEPGAVPGGVPSLGFISLTVNEDKAILPVFGGSLRVFMSGHWHCCRDSDYAGVLVYEASLADGFRDYKGRLSDKRVLVESLVDGSLAKIVNPCSSSRYFPGGRRRIKARIHRRLGRWYNCAGLLLSLTFSPGLISRPCAWRECRERSREFVNRVNRWRKRHGMPRAKYLSVIELQPGTGYPHLHLVFPYLRFLAPVAFMTETWGQAENSVDYKVRDSFSPVAYVCKYVSKLEGWSDVAMAYLWLNRTRLYSMSQDYSLPDYSDKRVPEWVFKRCMSRSSVARFFTSGLGGYETVEGGEDIVQEVLARGSS